MNLIESKQKFIETWGSLATQWGINRTMAQIHALLLISATPLSTEQIMEELQISRGNANMNTRALMDWGIVEKKLISGERREYFMAKKDIWEVFKQIAKERRKREIEPMMEILEQLQLQNNTDKSNEQEEFNKVTSDIINVTQRLNHILDFAIKSDEHWLASKIKNLFK